MSDNPHNEAALPSERREFALAYLLNRAQAKTKEGMDGPLAVDAALAAWDVIHEVCDDCGSKRDFLVRFVLARARVVEGPLYGVDVAKMAILVWDRVANSSL